MTSFSSSRTVLNKPAKKSKPLYRVACPLPCLCRIAATKLNLVYRLSSFRNVLIHDYSKVNLHRIWSMIGQDLLGLKYTIETILRERAEKEK